MIRALLFLIPLTAALLQAQGAHACSCAEQTPAEAFEQAAAVFEGRVTGVEGDGMPASVSTVAMQVVRTFKAADGETIEIRTRGNSAACGYGFEAGRSYLVYAYESSGELHTSLCSGTKAIEDADADLAVLGAGVTPVDPGPAAEPEIPAPVERPARGGCASCAVDAAGSPDGSWLVLALALGALLWRSKRDRSGPG